MECSLKDSNFDLLLSFSFIPLSAGEALLCGQKCQQSAVSNQTSLSLVFLDILCMGFVSQIKDLDSSSKHPPPGRSVSNS